MTHMKFLNSNESRMKRKVIVSSVVAMSLLTGGFSFAQGHEDRRDRGHNEQMQGGGPQDRQDKQARHPDRRQHQARQPNRPQSQGRANNSEHRDERGAGPEHQFHRGERLPIEYRNRTYVVDDWRAHQLSAPPRGYHWVQVGGDYVLVAIATGIILQLMLSN